MEKNQKSSYEFKYVYQTLIILDLILLIVSFWIPVASFYTSFAGIIFSQNGWDILFKILQGVFTSSLTGLIIAFFYKHRFEVEEKQRLFTSVNELIDEHITPKIVHAILYNDEMHEQLLSSDMIDKVLLSGLSKKVSDADKAKGLMDSLIAKVINASHTVRDLNISMKLNMFDDSARQYCQYDVYRMTKIYTYKTVLQDPSLKFMITNDRFMQNARQSEYDFCLFIDSSFSGDKMLFDIDDVSIGGVPLKNPTSDSEPNHFISYSYRDDSLLSRAGEEVQIKYKVSFLVRKNGNHFSHFVPFSTKDITIDFDATATDIKRLKVLTYYHSSIQPQIIYDDNTNPRTINISLFDWLFPKSGECFIWQYEEK